jgi:hypothetical protein
METLPFWLKVGKKESITWQGFHTARYRFQGFLRLANNGLLLEWSGTTKIEDVGFLGIKSRTHALPHEQLELPLEQLRGIELRGGWLRPRVELSTAFEALSIVPSEELGRVRLWIHLADRALAGRVVREVRRLVESVGLARSQHTDA